jgi:hypothetical protein
MLFRAYATRTVARRARALRLPISDNLREPHPQVGFREQKGSVDLIEVKEPLNCLMHVANDLAGRIAGFARIGALEENARLPDAPDLLIDCAPLSSPHR